MGAAGFWNPTGELSRRGRDDLAEAALWSACEQRQDVFAHPRPAEVGGDPVRVFGGCELEDQHEVGGVHPNDSRSRRAGVTDARHDIAARLLGLRGERVAQVEMVDHDRHPMTV
jgi:hypothetical protein